MRVVSSKPRRRLAPFRLEFGAGFIALLAVIYFFDYEGFVPALIPAVAVHELGHMTALILLGRAPRKLTASLSGFSLDYEGHLRPLPSLFTALAGPFFGLCYSFLCAMCGKLWNNDYLLLSAGIGLIINAFNLLPAFPLDGGRALLSFLSLVMDKRRARRIINALGFITAALLIAAGIFFTITLRSPALAAAGVWLLVMQKKEVL